MTTKPRHRLTLRDRLSRLTFTQACKYLGENGRHLIHQGGQREIDLDEQVYLRGDLYRLKLPEAVVTVTLMASANNRLHWNCTSCEHPCEHAGAAFSLILEEKTTLGLAAPPPQRTPVESLTEHELVQQALADREERAVKEKFRLQSTNPKKPWTDYTIVSSASGKSYRLALRGMKRGVSYCSCPDFRTNTLGTCKHILYALQRAKSKFTEKQLRRPYRRKHFSVHLTSGENLAIRIATPSRLADDARKIVTPIADRDIENVHDLIRRIAQLEKIGQHVHVYPDAEEFIQQQLYQDRIRDLVAEIRKNPARHPLRSELLKTELLPYQLDGIAFAVAAGRAVLADDMGLGKTMQGIGVAELLAREAGIRNVLVICPTSLKSQWRNEVQRFSNRSCQLVLGAAAERAEQYDNEEFFTVCNYEQVLRDLPSIERVKWDLIVLDEAQRIKNWEAKTTNTVKRLQSRFALVLSGTPLENRLDELYSIVQFVDDRRLGPAFRFLNRHRVIDEKGKVLGYKNLDQLRNQLQPILLRRTRADVLHQLPERTTEIVRIAPTGEQASVHDGYMRIVGQIVRKPYISEMDLLRLRQALLMCRMSANSTYLCNKQEPSFSSKLERIEELLERVFSEPDRKAVLFSEWTTMLDLVETIIERQGLGFVRLDGSVPQKKRQQLVNRFQNNQECQLFLTTNAGSTGLNLQAADTVINVDLPWNPAVLEQRIARAHRMGQKRPVQVYLLVTEETIEESLLGTLSAKKDLALAALDLDSEVDEVSMVSGTEELKNRLEILLGAKPEASPEAPTQIEKHDVSHAHRERVAAAGGEMLGAVFSFLGELVAQDGQRSAPPNELVDNVKLRLGECLTEGDDGRQQLSITLPNRQTVDDLAATLARLLVTQNNG